MSSFNTNLDLRCMSPYGYVSDINCPKDNPGCNCPASIQVLAPSATEPSTEDVLAAKSLASECCLIENVLGIEWFGIDPSDPQSSYNCFAICGRLCADVGEGLDPTKPGTAEEISINLEFEEVRKGNPNRYIEILPKYNEQPTDDGGTDGGTDDGTGGGTDGTGACCKNKDCWMTTKTECDKAGGTFYPQKTCADKPCGDALTSGFSGFKVTETGEAVLPGSVVSSLVSGSGSPPSTTNNTFASSPDNKLYFNYDKRLAYVDGDTVLSFPPLSSEIIGGVSGGVGGGDDLVCGPLIGRNYKYYKEYSKTSATFWNTPPETPLLRKAKTALMFTQRAKILVNGNLRIRPGSIISIDYNQFGGRWMVYKVQRIIKAQKHSMYLYIMRDGVG